MTNVAPEARLAMAPTQASLNRFPKIRLSNRPRTGAKTSHGARKANPVDASAKYMLTLHTVHLIHVNAALGFEYLDDQRQAHRHLRGRDRDHEKDKDLPTEAFEDTAERDHSQVGCIQHQLNGHKNDECIAADEHTQHANRKQDGRKNNVIIDRDHGFREPFSLCGSIRWHPPSRPAKGWM